jgi:hypothetical protein
MQFSEISLGYLVITTNMEIAFVPITERQVTSRIFSISLNKINFEPRHYPCNPAKSVALQQQAQ